MELPHFSAAAHIVHQIVGVSFATDESHAVLESAAGRRLRLRPGRSVREFHYGYQDWMRRMSKGCKSSHSDWQHAGAGYRECCIGFFAAFHRTFLYARNLLLCTVPYIQLNTHGGERSLAGLSIPNYHFLTMSWDPVYKLVKHIPRGRVITYGALAKALQLRGGARTAGRAMAATPSGRGIPWHRVVGDRGKLLIPEPHASLQRKLLESEGVKIVELRVDFAKHGWAPVKRGKSKSRKIEKQTRG
ncbi:MAG TPA: MGMT family protein [Candidatus Acidoferrum sp.]|nr:MGMT family protein [Candidatus Acidoferrum sp.]